MGQYSGSYRREEWVYRQMGYGRSKERRNIGLGDDPTVKKLLGLPAVPQTGRLLELGAGDGNGTVHLTKWPFDVLGVEISSTAVEMARQRLKATATRNAVVLEMDVITLDELEDRSFDLAIDSGCLHCLVDEDDRFDALASVHRVLKPDGSLLGSSQTQPIRTSPNSETCELRGEIIFTFRADDGWQPSRIIRNPEDLRTEFVRSGFAIVYWEHRVFTEGYFCHHVHYHVQKGA